MHSCIDQAQAEDQRTSIETSPGQSRGFVLPAHCSGVYSFYASKELSDKSIHNPCPISDLTYARSPSQGVKSPFKPRNPDTFLFVEAYYLACTDFQSPDGAQHWQDSKAWKAKGTERQQSRLGIGFTLLRWGATFGHYPMSYGNKDWDSSYV